MSGCCSRSVAFGPVVRPVASNLLSWTVVAHAERMSWKICGAVCGNLCRALSYARLRLRTSQGVSYGDVCWLIAHDARSRRGYGNSAICFFNWPAALCFCFHSWPPPSRGFQRVLPTMRRNALQHVDLVEHLVRSCPSIPSTSTSAICRRAAWLFPANCKVPQRACTEASQRREVLFWVRLNQKKDEAELTKPKACKLVVFR